MNVGSKVLVINGSARADSNTEYLINSVLDQYHLVNLHDIDIAHYRYDQKYGAGDDFLLVAERMVAADLIILATPVYWYAMSGYMKVFMDRWTDLVSTHKSIGRSLAGKRLALLAQSSSDALPDGFTVPIALTAEYMDMKYLGEVFWDSRTDLDADTLRSQVAFWTADH